MDLSSTGVCSLGNSKLFCEKRTRTKTITNPNGTDVIQKNPKTTTHTLLSNLHIIPIEIPLKNAGIFCNKNPMLRAEVGMRVLCANKASAE